MVFTATVYIQGVGVYVPHTDGKQLLVLFPSQAHAKAQGLSDSEGKNWCEHKLVVELDERSLDPSSQPGWRSQPVDGSCLGFDSTSSISFSLDTGKRIPGLPVVDDFLRKAGLGDAAPVRASVLDYSETAALSGVLYFRTGMLSADANFRGRWKIPRGNGTVVKEYASVLKLELGQVESFKLLRRGFGANQTDSLPLHPVDGKLEVWIRHYCSVGVKPMPEIIAVKSNEPDNDFTLNFALAERLAELIAMTSPPVPRMAGSWKPGDPIGDLAHKCMGAQVSERRSYSNPLEV